MSDNSSANDNQTAFTICDSMLNKIDSSFSCDIVDNSVCNSLCTSKVKVNLNPQNKLSLSHSGNLINTYHQSESSNSECDTTPSNMKHEVENISRDIEL